MAHTRKKSLDVALKLELPHVVQRVIAGEELGDPLEFQMGYPEELLEMTDEELKAYGGDEIVPLWDDGSFDQVVAYHPASQSFVAFFVEQGLNLDQCPRLNWQQVLLPTFLRLYEAEVEDDDFRLLADQFGFAYVDEIIAHYAGGGAASSLTHEPWRNALLDRMARQN